MKAGGVTANGAQVDGYRGQDPPCAEKYPGLGSEWLGEVVYG
jgi:hypothetical protein